jgi:hypothetical protein
VYAVFKKNLALIFFRPADLSIIKRNIENGLTKTFAHLERDLSLMVFNLIMYNRIPSMPDATVSGMYSEITSYYREILEVSLIKKLY